MSGQRRRRRRPSRAGAVAAVPLLALLAPLAGCASEPPPAARFPDVQRMLDARARAVQGRDAAGFLDSVDPRATGYRDRQRRVFGSLTALPLTDWHYDLVSTGAFPLPAGGSGERLAAEVRLRYRLKGYDTAPVTTIQYLTLTERDGRWRISSDSDGAKAGRTGTRQLWDQGPVRLVRGRHSLVLGGASDPARLRDLARRVDAAVPAVSAAWKGAWSGKVIVEAPDSVARMAQLLGGDDPSGYAGIAAVTTGEAGASTTAPADRVIINPEAYEEPSDLGRKIVLTHETTHVATRAATTAATPLWLSEGFADWVAYRGTHRKPAVAAPELSRAVATGRPPARLPGDADFGFDAGAARLARAYEGGWLACRMIADKWGEAKLIAFYRAVGKAGGATSAGMAVAPLEAVQPDATAAVGEEAPTAGASPGTGDDHRRPARAGRLDRAMRAQLGVGTAEFTRQWRAYVKRQLR
ncbi:hypothetical protein FCH28_20660 [Streptomyces piniterrae]|uniref:Lipoprotein n=1 Tax=Streptomyces piniterrae TaxID=2571125 RepID=A0A4U0NAI6_9ACTN|nr:hypothetical protein [Streptomyces piniterrae]TJZ50927.1 hypothetical protein FCH28_20660 [Streptomyces piniterrae]